MDVGVLTACIILLIAGSVALYKLPVQQCPKCPHCREIEHQKEVAQRQREEAEHERLHRSIEATGWGSCNRSDCDRKRAN